MLNPRQSRNTSLDFLRFVAILLVMIRHIHSSGNMPGPAILFVGNGGWTGVDLFFVLSGFLVSGLIFNEYETYGTFNPGRFLIRRGFKIYPTYYLFLGIAWGLTIVFHYANAESNRRYLYEALFITNYETWQFPIHGWLWSICVEEHFYLLLCVLLVILIRWNWVSARVFWGIYLTFLVIGLVLRFYDVQHLAGDDLFRATKLSHVRFDSLFFGVLLSYLYRQKALVKWRSTALTVLAVAGVALPFVLPLDNKRFEGLNLVVLLATNPVCYGYLMIRMLEVQASWMRPFAYIGKYSYSIYLFHGFINENLVHRLSGWTYLGAYIVISLIAGIVVSKLVEYPFLALRDRFFPSRSKKQLAVAPVLSESPVPR